METSGNPYTDLVQLMKEHGHNKDVDIVFGTITAPPPNIRVKVDNESLELKKDDVSVLEHLTRHKRIVTINHVEKAQRDVGDGVGVDKVSGDGQIFTVNDDLKPPYSSFSYNYVELTFEDVLKVGDRVVLAEIEKGQKYVILDREVIY
ncbi:DUF2577 domain-containing protein [Aneurinibacillus migulanus]|uniref:DUF2577 domain-containing protein n=2 Tax=Aneurinibacillus migulanus TaxID=47500 RepID=A0A1G8PU80_ANEMI|nr:DUF2577 domain-containing protein [Aneurinibacillus migulanus]MED0892754.1 DUF2577 domain-containing protein [Aneurinibacillus migulanus]MED1619000.1 DUF2577 domain-containing protein [Aneurinibacillus migulanus]GED14425.1 hypothetical protein AMI01nite_24160 [Aneurinibacillus migulanus]SDI95430.1 Protein of unknown function [Aneurinibacillus migulanus]